jgi:hypothetical protein
MIQVTLTNVNQLLDYTHINQYIVFSYQNENANHQYFGNFSESTGLMNDDARIEVLDVQSVSVSENENGITNFIMTSNSPIRITGSDSVPLNDGSYGHTLAFNEITEDMRFDVVIFDTVTILVLYQKYVLKTNQDNDIIPELEEVEDEHFQNIQEVNNA